MVKLTKKQQDVLTLLTDEYLTIKQIAIRRQITIRAVQKIAKKLRDKGMLKSKRFVFRCTPYSLKSFPLKNAEHQIRLHAQEFNIKILYKDARYKQILNKANTINIDGNTIMLYRNSIEIYSGQSFYSDDVETATADSFNYWNRLFSILENDLNIILIKSRTQNIKLVKQHYSEINNELAKECINSADKIKVFTTDTHKVWFLIDNSFNLHEAETIHSETAKQDMAEVIRPFFNDLRNNKPPLLSEIWQITANLTNLFNNNTNIYTNSIKALTEQIDMHLEVMRNIGHEIKRFGNSVDTFNAELKAFHNKSTITPIKSKKVKKGIIEYLFENPLKLAKFKAMSKAEQNKILFGGVINGKRKNI